MHNTSNDKLASPPLSGKNWYQLTTEESLQQLNTTTEGLSQQDAAERLKKHGPNSLPEKKRKHPLIQFFAHFNDVLIYILLAAALVKGLMGHAVDTIIILCVAVINALIGFVQENKAEKSLKSIQNMLSSKAVVIREGVTQIINAQDLVIGDIVTLKPGDKIPADLRLLEAHNLQIEEAILTGESTVVEKQIGVIENEAVIGDRKNLLFSGTTISAGTAKGVVIATGGDTELAILTR